MPLTGPHWETGSLRTWAGICKMVVALWPHLPGYGGYIGKEQHSLKKPESSSKHMLPSETARVKCLKSNDWGNSRVQTNQQHALVLQEQLWRGGWASSEGGGAPSTNWPPSHQVLSPCGLHVSFPNLGPFFLVVPTLMTEINPWHFPTAKSS